MRQPSGISEWIALGTVDPIGAAARDRRPPTNSPATPVPTTPRNTPRPIRISRMYASVWNFVRIVTYGLPRFQSRSHLRQVRPDPDGREAEHQHERREP